jgi:putative DNA primase/helicase
MFDPHEDRLGAYVAFTKVSNAQGMLINEGTLRFLDSGDCLRFAQRCAQMNGTRAEQWNARLLLIAHHVQEHIEHAPWPHPQPLPDGLRPVPPLPERLLPEALRGWLADIADRLQVPLEFPAVGAVVALASVVGNQVRIRPKARDDWTVTPNLWGAVVGQPGAMKSPALEEAIRPLKRLIHEAEGKHTEAMQDWAFTKEAFQATQSATRDKMKKAAKDGKDLEQFRAALSGDTPAEPTERRYMVNDATVEKLGVLLNENPYGLLLFRDELTGWLRALNDDRRSNDRAFYLEAWNGNGSYNYDRIERGTIKIHVVTTSVLGGIQPGPLQAYLRGALRGSEEDDGLLQRLQLLVYPDLPPAWTYVDRWPETDAKNQAFAVFKSLRSLHACPFDGETDDDDRPLVRFARDAQQFFAAWYAELHEELRSDTFEHKALESHFVKYASLMPSLALVFELADWAARAGSTIPPHVSLPYAQQAAAWCDFLWAHAQRVYGLGVQDTALRARTLVHHLLKGDVPTTFTARDVYHRHWSGLDDEQSVSGPLDLLEHLGWLRSHRRQTGGRPTTVFTVNPSIGGAQP